MVSQPIILIFSFDSPIGDKVSIVCGGGGGGGGGGGVVGVLGFGLKC